MIKTAAFAVLAHARATKKGKTIAKTASKSKSESHFSFLIILMMAKENVTDDDAKMDAHVRNEWHAT